MKKFLLVVAIIVLGLFIIDKTILKDKGIVQNLNEKYAKLENPETIEVGIEEGERAPDFTLYDLQGESVRLSDYKGKTVLLNFWATWCPPCRAEMPHMEKLYKKYKEAGFEIVGVNAMTSEKNRDDVNQFVEEYQLTFTIPLDEDGKAFSDYGIMVYPTSFFIDSDGIIRKKVLGAVDEEAMEKLIQRLP